MGFLRSRSGVALNFIIHHVLKKSMKYRLAKIKKYLKLWSHFFKLSLKDIDNFILN